jgi:hypothetical protein
MANLPINFSRDPVAQGNAAIRAAGRVDDAIKERRNLTDLQKEADEIFLVVGRASSVGLDPTKVLLGELMRVVDAALSAQAASTEELLKSSDALRRERFRREASALIDRLAKAD